MFLLALKKLSSDGRSNLKNRKAKTVGQEAPFSQSNRTSTRGPVFTEQTEHTTEDPHEAPIPRDTRVKDGSSLVGLLGAL